MRMRRALVLSLFAVFVLNAASAFARSPLSLDLAEDHVDITTAFTGDWIIAFGNRSVKGDIAVVLEGPRRDVVVRRKSRVFGAWINRSWVTFKDMPLYYDYALSVEDPDAFVARGIGVKGLPFKSDDFKDDEAQLTLYKEAFIRGREALSFYPVGVGAIEFLDDGFFKVRMHIPANVPKGVYTMKAFLFKNGRIIHEERQDINIGQVGFSAGVYNFSQNRAFLYAALCVFLALLSGWLSNKIARKS